MSDSTPTVLGPYHTLRIRIGSSASIGETVSPLRIIKNSSVVLRMCHNGDIETNGIVSSMEIDEEA